MSTCRVCDDVTWNGRYLPAAKMFCLFFLAEECCSSHLACFKSYRSTLLIIAKLRHWSSPKYHHHRRGEEHHLQHFTHRAAQDAHQMSFFSSPSTVRSCVPDLVAAVCVDRLWEDDQGGSGVWNGRRTIQFQSKFAIRPKPVMLCKLKFLFWSVRTFIKRQREDDWWSPHIRHFVYIIIVMIVLYSRLEL